MTDLFKKQSAKFVQNPSSFTKVMAKHILVCFFMPHSVLLTTLVFSNKEKILIKNLHQLKEYKAMELTNEFQNK